MTIFQRSLAREFTAVGMAVLMVLTAIFVIANFVKLLGRAANGLEEPQAVIALLGFGLLSYLPVVLAVSLFIAVLLTLARAYRDSEMPVWFSSGLSITAWVRPVMGFAIPIVSVTALLSLFLTPWALSQSVEFAHMLRSQDEISRVSPGSFVEARSANWVFFVDKNNTDTETLNNVFVQYNQNGRFGVIVAEKGFQKVEANGDKFLVLTNGRRYEGTPSALDFRIVDFESYMMRSETREASRDEVPTRALPTLALILEPNNERLAELHWRIALPLVALVLALLAIPLSFVNPRSGASSNLILAGLVFALYYNSLGIFQAWTRAGVVPTWLGLTPVHLGMVVILAVLFLRQMFAFRWLLSARR